MRKNKRQFFLTALLTGLLAGSAFGADQAADPSVSSRELKYSLASSLAASRQYERAALLCHELLEADPADLNAKLLLADIDASTRRYADSERHYNEVLSVRPSREVRLKKARMLGWAGHYQASLSEYQALLAESPDPLIQLEMNAKRFYWNHWVRRGIEAHERLIREDPKNTEAFYHRTQLYAHEGMWPEAEIAFLDYQKKDPNDPRGREGLEEVRSRSSRPEVEVGYDFYESDSVGRDSDIHRHSVLTALRVPVRDRGLVSAGGRYAHRSFSDHPGVDENEVRAGIEYRKGPEFWARGSFARFDYSGDFPSLDTFGAAAGTRLWDLADLSFRFSRERLENSSRVLLEGLYQDNYLERMDWDLTQRFKLGADYLYTRVSDGNSKHEPGLDALYYVSFEPSRLTLKYRVFYRDYDRVDTAYFSPRNFWTHQWRADWRYYLGTNDVYFGWPLRYLGASYDCFLDSQNIVSHRFAGEFRWEFAKNKALAVEGFYSHASANVYTDKGLTVSFEVVF